MTPLIDAPSFQGLILTDMGGYLSICCCWFTFLALSVSAAPGLIQTTTGKVIQGELRLDNGQFAISTTNGLQHIPLQQIDRLRIQTAAELANRTTNVDHGLRGTYYVNSDFTGDSLLRIDPSIDFDWQDSPPMPGIGPGEFSVRWEGKIQAPASGLFHFFAQGENVRVWIDDKLLIEKTDYMSVIDSDGSIQMLKGKYYSFKMEFICHSAPPITRLFWNGPNIRSSLVPTQVIFPSSLDPADRAQVPKHGLLGLYFKTLNTSGEYLMRYDTGIDFDWAEDPPISGIESDRFSVRWLGKIIPPASGTYIFQIKAEDGARVWINGNLIIDAWREEPVLAVSAPLALIAGQKCDLRVEMFCAHGKSCAQLSWNTPGMPMAVIPTTQLAPTPAPDLPKEDTIETTPPGVLLASGSYLAWPFDAIDQSAVKLSGGVSPSLSLINVARIVLHPLTAEATSKLLADRTGLLLRNQDFVEGDFRGISNGQVAINTILFGTKTFPVNDVLAITLRDLKPPPAQFQLRLRNGSTLMANSVRIEPNSILFHESIMRAFRVAWSDLLEIRRN